MKALVTGAHGFVGSHLVSRLEQLGYDVLKGDREGNIPEKVDLLFDTASYGNIYGQDDIREIDWANVGRVASLLEQTKKYKQAVVTSSSSVSMGHLTYYAEAKRNMESIATLWGVTIVRPYTVYGYGDNPKHLLPKLFNSALKGKSLDLSPKPDHDYIYIDDLIDLYLKPPSKLVEAGTGIATSNIELLGLVEEVTNRKVNVKNYITSRPYDQENWRAPKPAKKGMVTLKEGLQRIYENYK